VTWTRCTDGLPPHETECIVTLRGTHGVPKTRRWVAAAVFSAGNSDAPSWSPERAPHFKSDSVLGEIVLAEGHMSLPETNFDQVVVAWQAMPEPCWAT